MTSYAEIRRRIAEKLAQQPDRKPDESGTPMPPTARETLQAIRQRCVQRLAERERTEEQQ